MNKVVGRSAILLILVLALSVGSVLFLFEYLFYADDWVMKEGSPHVYTDYSSVCGTIVDRNGILLLDTNNGRTYGDDPKVNSSMIHWLGDKQGFIYAPTISHYAEQMTSFDPINGLYVYGNDNGKVKLTFSAKVQAAALDAMAEYKGTVAVYNYKTGQILCAVTTPTYDPDNVPDINADTSGVWEGAYINRFTKATYTPGSIFKIVTTIAALETIPDIMEQTFQCNGETEYGIDKVTCMEKHGKINLQDAFLHSCNCAFAAVADQLGGQVLQQYAQNLGISKKLTFDGITTASGSLHADGAADVLVAWSAIGQHKDQINPCQFMTLMGTIAGEGKAAAPYFVESITGGAWGEYFAHRQDAPWQLNAQTANMLKDLMRNNVESYYGDENFPGLTVCAKSGTAELGGDLTPNAMFAGFVADEKYPLAFIVVAENAGFGRKNCVPILSKVLAACKEVIDSEYMLTPPA